MTIDKFNQASAEYRRRSWAGIGLAFLAFFGTFGLGLGLIRVFDLRAACAASFGEPAAETLEGVVMLLAFPAFMAVILYGDRRASSDPRLRCPHCDKHLEAMSNLVVATRNCPHCGRRVLEEPPPAPGPVAPD